MASSGIRRFLLLLVFVIFTVSYLVLYVEQGQVEESIQGSGLLIALTSPSTTNVTRSVPPVSKPHHNKFSLFDAKFKKIQQEFNRVCLNECDFFQAESITSCLSSLKRLDKQMENDLFDESSNETSNHRASKCEQCIFADFKLQTIYYHTYFSLSMSMRDNVLLRQASLYIMSFLATQNSCCTKLIIWTLPIFEQVIRKHVNQNFSFYTRTGRVQVRVFEISTLCNYRDQNMYSSFRNHPICMDKTDLTKFDTVLFSDFVRFFILDIYGGIWSDLDVIYLKDARLLWNQNFAYRWSNQNYYNTAVLGIDKYHNPSIKALYAHLKTMNGIESIMSWLYPIQFTSMMEFVSHQKRFSFNSSFFNSYSSYFFDPAWLCNDHAASINASEFSVCEFKDFSSISWSKLNSTELYLSHFFPGAFTYHLHFKHTQEVYANSFYEMFERFFRSMLKL